MNARTEYYPGLDGERVEAIETVHELLHRPRSSADFLPAARYAVQRLCDYAAQEHELRGKAEERCNKLQKQVLDANQMAVQTSRTNDDLRQQLSFMQQALMELQNAGV